MAKTKRMESGDSGTVFTTSDFDALHVRRVVASNPNTPRQVLERLASEGSALTGVAAERGRRGRAEPAQRAQALHEAPRERGDAAQPLAQPA